MFSIKKVISSILLIVISLTFTVPPQYAQAQLALSSSNGLAVMPGIVTTANFVPAIIKGVNLDPQNPLKFDFIVDKGTELLPNDAFKKETQKLVRYFLASLEKQKIYNQYVEAFRKGASNAIKEEYDPNTQQIVARKYFSGGIPLSQASQAMLASEAEGKLAAGSVLSPVELLIEIKPADVSEAPMFSRLNRLGRILFMSACLLLTGNHLPAAELSAKQTQSRGVELERSYVFPSLRNASIGSAKVVNEIALQESNIKNITQGNPVIIGIDPDNSLRKSVTWEWQKSGDMWTTFQWANGKETIDFSDNLNNLVFRFTISGADGSGYDVVFEDDQGREIGFSSTEHISVNGSKQFALIRLDAIKNRNSEFNWSAVKPLKFKAASERGKVLIQSPMILDVGTTRQRGMGIGIFDGGYVGGEAGEGESVTSKFDHRIPGPGVLPASVLFFTSIYDKPITDQWKRLKENQVPHEVLEFGKGQVLDMINGGKFDAQLKVRAEAAAEYGKKVLIRPMHEPMGGWYAWSVKTRQDADNYIKAWKRIIEIYKNNGADNVLFVFSPHNFEPQGIEQKSNYQLLDYILSNISNEVDVIGLDAYSYPPGGGNFNGLTTGMISKLSKYGIPIIMGEMGSAMPDDAKNEFRNYLRQDLKNGMFPEIVGLTIFDISKFENGAQRDFRPPVEVMQQWQQDPFFTRGNPFNALTHIRHDADSDETKAFGYINKLAEEKTEDTVNSESYKQLVRMGSRAVPALIKNLANLYADTNSRKWSALLLGEVGGQEVVSVLQDVINSDQYELWHKIEAQHALERLKERGITVAAPVQPASEIRPSTDAKENESAEGYISQLTNEHPEETTNSAPYNAITAMGEKAVPALIKNLKNVSADTNSRKWSARLLGYIGSYDQVYAPLKEALKGNDNDYPLWIKAEAREGLRMLQYRNKDKVIEINEVIEPKSVMVAENGGIDLNAAHFSVGVDRQGKGFEYSIDPVMLQQFLNAPGVAPVILNIRTIPDLPVFLGLI
ncbi:MAG: hypothetical protein HQL26_09330 [Candidatus Omnitrophica bacterium]|nr:hypothetical protein [Candidatus Omnitrophota bacterium]